MGLVVLLVINSFTLLNALVRTSTANGTFSLTRTIPRYMPNNILQSYDAEKANFYHDLLVKGAQKGAQPAQKFDFARCHRNDSTECLNSGKESVFEAANVSYPVPKSALMAIPKTDGGTYKVVKMNRCALLAGEVCLAYAFGISEGSEFENMVAGAGCEVHAFDCTVDEEQFKHKNFHFHPWCISPEGKNVDNTNGQYKTLSQTLKALRHPRIDTLKLDIDGLEYQVIEDILKGPVQPLQIVVEMHTEEATTKMASEANVKGKGYNEVSDLFLKMFDKGYRTISKRINTVDRACADFNLLNVDQLKEMGPNNQRVYDGPC